MGENEDGVVVGRFVAPPARPLLVAPGPAVDRAEHVSAHHAGPDVLARFLDYPCALVHLAALLAVGLAPGGQAEPPSRGDARRPRLAGSPRSGSGRRRNRPARSRYDT